MRRSLTLLALPLALAAVVADQPNQKTESFFRDPGWEGVNNRVKPTKTFKITQDFGYADTSLASKKKGEIGGKVWRSSTPAYYAEKIDKKTLDDKLTASGTFALSKSGGGSGVFFGWFSAEQPGGGRPLSSLGLGFDGEKSGARLMVHAIST